MLEAGQIHLMRAASAAVPVARQVKAARVAVPAARQYGSD